MDEYKATGAQERVEPFAKGVPIDKWLAHVWKHQRHLIATEAEIKEWYRKEAAAREAKAQATADKGSRPVKETKSTCEVLPGRSAKS